MFYNNAKIDVFVMVIFSLLYFTVNIIFPYYVSGIIIILVSNVILILFSILYHILRSTK